MKIIQDIVLSIKNQVKNLSNEFLIILKKPKDLIIWLILIPIVTFFMFLIIFFLIIFYFYYLMKLIFYIVYLKIINKNIIKIISMEKNIIVIRKNIYLMFLKKIIIEQAEMKSFLLLYAQLKLMKDIKKEEKINIIEGFLYLFSMYLFRVVFLIITGIPLIIIKNCNFVLKNIKEVNRFKKAKISIRGRTLMYNLIIKYTIILEIKSKANKIILKKNNITLNIKEKEIEYLKNLIDIKLWIESSSNLIDMGIFANMKYFTYNNLYIPYHPTLHFYNNASNEYFITNQTTGEYLKIWNKINDIKKSESFNNIVKVKLNLEIKKIFDEGKAYITIPHTVNENYVELDNPTDLILEISKEKNILTKFKFIQSFFINFEHEIYKHDPKNGLIIDENYLSVKNYITADIDNFSSDIKNELEKILEFYEKNKLFMQENKLNFIDTLNKADTSIEIKNIFLEIIHENQIK